MGPAVSSAGEESDRAQRTARVRAQKRERGAFPSTSYRSSSDVCCDPGFTELDLDLRVRLQQSAENSLWAGIDQNHRLPEGTWM